MADEHVGGQWDGGQAAEGVEPAEWGNSEHGVCPVWVDDVHKQAARETCIPMAAARYDLGISLVKAWPGRHDESPR